MKVKGQEITSSDKDAVDYENEVEKIGYNTAADEAETVNRPGLELMTAAENSRSAKMLLK